MRGADRPPALQPTFREDGYFVCGTEVQVAEAEGEEAKKKAAVSNKLVFSKADFKAGCLAKRDDGTTCVWTYPLNEVPCRYARHRPLTIAALALR